MANLISKIEGRVPGPVIQIKTFVVLQKERRLRRLKAVCANSAKVKRLRAECIAYWQRIHSLESLRGDGPAPRVRYLLQFVLSEDEFGDLEEGYNEVKKRGGRSSADRWYYSQLLRSAWPFAVKALRRVIYIVIEEWIRRRF